jgi:hypothetical protein
MTRTARVTISVLTALSVLAITLGASARRGEASLDDVRAATVQFQDPAAAEQQNYGAFLECFDSPEGGMGQHFVNLGLLDGEVSATQPESLVYEVKAGGGYRLVAVEWIVPGTEVDPNNPPQLFGQTFHLNPELSVWILHAWIWKTNPSGMFFDWNPRVAACP